MSRKRYIKWKYDEIVQLISLYEQGLSIQTIANRINRTQDTVRAQVYELRSNNLIVQGKRVYPEDWSMVEDQYLIQNLGKLSITQLSGALGRSAASVKKRVGQLNKLNNRTRSAWNKQRDKRVANEYADDGLPDHLGYTRSGFRPKLGVSVRSSWENNFLAYLNYKGIEWDYEPKLFVFGDVIRGAKSYLPDVYLPPPVDKWIEVKGRMLSVSKTKTKRFKMYYPEDFAKLEVVVKKNSEADKFYKKMGIPVYIYYDELEKNFTNIPNWEGKTK